jgi:hypothetical protein
MFFARVDVFGCMAMLMMWCGGAMMKSAAALTTHRFLLLLYTDLKASKPNLNIIIYICYSNKQFWNT